MKASRSIPSAHKLPHARQPYYAGVQTMRARICSALSCAMFARVVWLRLRRAAKPPTFTISFAARTCHARLARLTRARRGGSEGGRCESSLLTFAALFVSEKREKRKVSLRFFAGRRGADPYKLKPKYSQLPKQKIHTLSRQRTY